ncbi:methyltransferase, FxLD system [Nocardiopsis gilva YIM 90087]|uniref:Protein-L-isoaspartate O-methyltransferase n=1 Tax=Nocardiopsis gilva YIM 90087 TaxID=1235441 RepID=A0A223SCH5_9ACTN|nr:methyltransferase, FxLD system [Nocardiopsis gilva]ASU85802.1 methyltransferase, FxLD system [Nocardiopsis gilva YIM 90087]
MSENATIDPGRAEELRDQAVTQLVTDGTIVSQRVEAAMRAVPRERFAPEAALEDVYSPYGAVITKRDEHRVAVSSVSAAQIQAMMLEQADLRPGHRVLEIGSGGYNAALLAEIVGPGGAVTTIDIDPEVTERATRLLKENGYERVRVVRADAAQGVPEHAPYDRILVTAGAWDIPPAWMDQLAAGGRLVVPLRMRNLTRSISFLKSGDHLTSTSARICGFVPMQGAEEHRETLVLVNGTEEIALRFDDEVPADPHQLDNAILHPRVETWTGVTVGLQEVIDTLQLYLATHLPGFCIMAVDPNLDTGLVSPNNPRFSLAAVDDDTFAYLVTRRTPEEQSVEYGIHAYGPHGAAFADAVSEHVRTWAREQRGGPGPRIDVYPVSADVAADLVITKMHTRVTFTWPPATAAG